MAVTDFVVASLHTRHYHWEGVGLTEAQAGDALTKGWEAAGNAVEHLLEIREDINYYHLKIGAAYRDGEPITTKEHA